MTTQSTSEDTAELVAERMYGVLLLMNCWCTHKWHKEERVLTHQCSRCSVMTRWEKLTGKPPHPTVPTAKGKMETK